MKLFYLSGKLNREYRSRGEKMDELITFLSCSRYIILLWKRQGYRAAITRREVLETLDLIMPMHERGLTAINIGAFISSMAYAV